MLRAQMGSLVPHPIPLLNLELATRDLLRLLRVELPNHLLCWLSGWFRTTVCLEEVRRNLLFSLTAILDLEEAPKTQ